MRKTFKSNFLKWLYGELVLTQSFQKVTLFHFMFVLLPAVGLGIGVAAAEGASGWINKAPFAVAGIAVGCTIAWFLPQILWKLLEHLSKIESLTESIREKGDS